MHDKPDLLSHEREVIDEPPPALGTWPRVYRFILIELAVVIALFYWFSRSYAA